MLIIQLVSYIKLIGNYFNFIEDYRINFRKITSIYKQELKLFEHGSKRVQGNKITERFLRLFLINNFFFGIRVEKYFFVKWLGLRL